MQRKVPTNPFQVSRSPTTAQNHDVDPGGDAQRLEPEYAPISVSKFVVLDVVTCGLYSIVWFYRSWRYIKRRDGSSVWPWARALFNPITYYLLLEDLRDNSGRAPHGAVVLAYFFINLLWRLPDPYWLLSYLSFIPLIPAINSVNEINRLKGVRLPPQARWRARSVALALLLAPFFVFMIASSTGHIPSTMVLKNTEISERYGDILEELGVVSADDSLLFYYTLGLFSIRGEGVVLTNNGVHVYWTDAFTGELKVEAVTYADIQVFDAEWSTNPLEDTIVRIYLRGGTRLQFELSAEEGRDREFVAELRRRHNQARSDSPDAPRPKPVKR